MHDTEKQQPIRASQLGDDVRELNRRWYTDSPGQLTPEHVEIFHVVTGEMTEILSEMYKLDTRKHQELSLNQDIGDTLELALTSLLEAKNARHAEDSEFISGIERDMLLNQALMHLQPILVMGLDPNLKGGQAIYNDLVHKINEVRRDISSAIRSEIMYRTKQEPKKKSEQDDEEDDGSQDDDHSDSGDGISAGDDVGADAGPDHGNDISADSDAGERDSNDGDGKRAAETGKSGFLRWPWGRRGKGKDRDSSEQAPPDSTDDRDDR
ncbi:MAG: hypothetical protein AAGC55_32465 [Myxococcota bacterium]